jgi:hypothetical protein
MAPGHCGEPGASLTVERFAGSLDPSREGDGKPNVGVLLLASIKGGDTRLGTGRPVEKETPAQDHDRPTQTHDQWVGSGGWADPRWSLHGTDDAGGTGTPNG